MRAAEPTKFQVRVDLQVTGGTLNVRSSDPANVEAIDKFRSLIARELRQIGDVVITTNNPRLRLEVNVLPIVQGARLTGYSLATILSASARSLSNTVYVAGTADFKVMADFQHYVFMTADAGDYCARIVHGVDSFWFGALRQGAQNSADEAVSAPSK